MTSSPEGSKPNLYRRSTSTDMAQPTPGCLLGGLPTYVYNPPIEAVVLAFGVNEDAQLGLDGYQDVLSPKVVEALLGTRLRGREFARSPIIAGSRNTMAITADGEILAWGWNARATLGMGHRDPVPKPRRIPGLRGVKIVQVALGGWHAVALDEQGQVWAWGGTEYSQASTSPQEHDPGRRDVVVPTPCLTGMRVRQVCAGGMSSLALTEDGHLWTWGEPWGDFSLVIDRRPRRIDTTGDFVRIACGAFHSLAVTHEGELYSWGINDFGQLGNGTTSYATSPQRVTEGLEGVVVADVAAGGWHSIALGADGTVFAWGRGEWGRLGVGDRKGTSKLRPTKVEALDGMRVVEAAAGGTHSIFVTEDGRAFITGRGSFGRLGSGTEEDAYSPVEVKLPGGPERWRVISAAAGGRSSFLLALPDNGDLEGREAEWLARRTPLGISPQPSGTQIDALRWTVPGGEADDEADEEEESVGGTSEEVERDQMGMHAEVVPRSPERVAGAAPQNMVVTPQWREIGQGEGDDEEQAEEEMHVGRLDDIVRDDLAEQEVSEEQEQAEAEDVVEEQKGAGGLARLGLDDDDDAKEEEEDPLEGCESEREDEERFDGIEGGVASALGAVGVLDDTYDDNP